MFTWRISTRMFLLDSKLGSNSIFNGASYATLHPALSIGLSVGWSNLTLFYVFYSLTVLLLPKCLGDLKYGLCSPTRDWGSRVSGLV